MIQLRRVYEEGSTHEGTRFLVERLWPRGIQKKDLQEYIWQKDAAPSSQLRKWFHHDPEKWPEFQERYLAELKASPEGWKPILDAARRGTVTLLYSSRDQEHNNTIALKRYLEKKLQSR